jgi:X-X-X-Leu-X-X-Gly heptad repeat protein
VGISPGTLVWGETATNNLNELSAGSSAWSTGTYDLQGRPLAQHQATSGQLLLHVNSLGAVSKRVVVRMD